LTTAAAMAAISASCSAAEREAPLISAATAMRVPSGAVSRPTSLVVALTLSSVPPVPVLCATVQPAGTPALIRPWPVGVYVIQCINHA
jgi:hypothetical protein